MKTEKRNRRSPLASSRADELVYAIALAMARRQMRRSWGVSVSLRDGVPGGYRGPESHPTR